MIIPINCRCSIGIKITMIFLLILFLFPSVNSGNEGLAISLNIIGNDEIHAPGETIYVISEIRNSASSGRVDVIVTYSLMDNEKTLATETTTVAIETLSSFSHEITLPSTISSGSYLLKATVSSLDKTDSSEAATSISIMEVNRGGQQFIEYIMLFALCATMGALFLEHRRITKMKLEKNDLNKYIKTK